MTSASSALRQIAANVDESIGLRQRGAEPQLSPVASAKDVGRTPLRRFGKLRLDQVVTDPRQPRSEFNPEEIERLAASIRSTGQLHPIRVRWDGAMGKWVVITGERRYRAAKAAGLAQIDCYFHDEAISDSDILKQQLVENLLRQDLKPLEEARGYQALIELSGWTGKQVAEALGVSAAKVSRALSLLELPREVQEQVASGTIGRTAAYELAKLENDLVQRDLAQQAANGALTHQKTSSAVRQRRGKKPAKSRGIRQVFESAGGIKVTVSASRKVNYHEIEEALIEALEEVRLRIESNVQLF